MAEIVTVRKRVTTVERAAGWPDAFVIEEGGMPALILTRANALRLADEIREKTK
jgi:hypothetical protein